MKKFIIINKETKNIVYKYEDEKKQVFGGAWGDEETHEHIEVSSQIDLNYAKIENNQVVEDVTKKQEHLARKQLEDQKKAGKEQAALSAKKFDLNKVKDADVREALSYILKVIG